MIRSILSLCIFSCGLTAAASGTTAYRKISDTEFREKNIVVYDSIDISKKWQFRPDLKKASWRPVEIGRSIFHQNIPSRGTCWYKVDFTIPEKYLNGELLLDMGYISSFDETLVNGVKVGSTGSLPPAKPVFGSSWMHRKYRMPAAGSPFKAGKNQILVKTWIGYMGGMYKGIPKLSKLGETCWDNYRLKGKGRDSLEIFLSDAEHLNRYAPGSPVMIAPEFAYISPEKNPVKASFCYRVLDSGRSVVRKGTFHFLLKNGQWSRLPVMRFGTFPKGSYICEYMIVSGKKQLLKKTLRFEFAEPKKFSIPVDKKLAWNGKNARVLKDTFGHTGPRQLKNDSLVNDPPGSDARGALTFSSLCSDKENSPLIFMNNIRPVPKKPQPAGYFVPVIGSKHDGFPDAWMLGRISIGRQKKNSSAVVSSTWTERAWHYKYPGNLSLVFSINELSPAWRIYTNAKTVNLFDGIRKHGLGLPSKMAFVSSSGKIKVVDSAKSFSGAEMKENWVLAWFNGSENWSEFDIPWLFTFQKKPLSVAIGKEALTIKFKTPGAGFISGMPLCGVKLLKLSETDTWKRDLPENIAKKCRLWSSVLAAAPKMILRSFQQDFKKDEMKIRDQFQHFRIKDDWNTKPLIIAPLSPVMTLAADSGNIQIKVNRKNRDLSLPTLHGPYVAVTDAKEVVTSVKGLLRFVNETRTVKTPSNAATSKLRKELADKTSSFMKRITTHPWEEMFWHGKWYVPGNVERPALANIILIAPYLPDNIKKQVSDALRIIMEKYAFREGKPDNVLKARLPERLRDQDLSFTIKGFSGKKMSSFQSRQHFGGIDALCIESCRLYTLWLYAVTFNRFDLADRHWDLLNRLFNWIPNSHDWATSVSWDSICGLRVGNGLQESSLAHVGAAAMARFAHRRKDFKLRDTAAYFAVMQLIGMQGALNANTYLREQRPWPSTHTLADDMAYAERERANHYSEFNEFAGFSQCIISARKFINSTGSFILTTLPGTMRPYQDIWSDATDDFFTPSKIDPAELGHRPISMEHYMYMTKYYPIPFEQVWNARNQNARRFFWYQQLADIRAAIEYHSKVTWEKLW